MQQHRGSSCDRIYTPTQPTSPRIMDPLAALPAEIVLRILEFASLSGIAALIGTSRSWQAFIHLHEDAIYAAHLPHVSPATTPHEYMSSLKAFRPDLISAVRDWKDVCRRRCLLQDAWNSPSPMPIATVYQIGVDPVWRFCPDFDRRLIVSTSQAGGVSVNCLDTGDLLWSLGRHEVRPFAHLEYHNGIAVWVCIAYSMTTCERASSGAHLLNYSSLFVSGLLTYGSRHTGPFR